MQIDNGKIIRQSNFELLRLVSMLFIVYYHLVGWFVYGYECWEHKALFLPLHIGVICFVLISGYFGIKPSFKGLFRFVGMFFVLCLPEIIYNCIEATSFKGLFHSCLFISHTHYWFVRTYLALYLLSPLINAFNEKVTNKQKWLMFGVLCLISMYMGNIWRYPIYEDGKNVINFLCIYQFGHMLAGTQSRWKEFAYWKLLLMYVLLNVVMVVGFYSLADTLSGEILWLLSFPYNSPLLMVNAIMFFMLFGKMSFASTKINSLAKGVFAIYIIHCNIPFAQNFEKHVIDILYQHITCFPLFILTLLLMAIVVVFLCLFIYWMLTPIWKCLDKLAVLLTTKYSFLQ